MGSNAFVDLSCQHFGKLKVKEFDAKKKRGYYWFCECECGEIVSVCSSHLKTGKTSSCGCSRKGINRTHGMSATKLYAIHGGIKNRCNNPNNSDYPNYGGRGIEVCDEWSGISGFINFAKDMGEPKWGQSLERKDNNKGYSPENCKWSDPLSQARNTRRNVNITICGETKCLSAWADVIDINQNRTYHRLSSSKWAVACALWLPINGPGLAKFARQKRILNNLKF